MSMTSGDQTSNDDIAAHLKRQDESLATVIAELAQIRKAVRFQLWLTDHKVGVRLWGTGGVIFGWLSSPIINALFRHWGW